MYTNKILQNESCMNDAYLAAFSNFKKRSETPKIKPRPESIWDLKNETADDIQSNRRSTRNVHSENSKCNDAHSFGRISFYEVGDEAIWGNITDEQYPSNKINTDSEMRETNPVYAKTATNRNFVWENKHSPKSPVCEKISFVNGRWVKHSSQPVEHQSLRFNRVNELITEKNESEINILKKTKRVSFQDHNDYNQDVEMKTDEEIEYMDVVRSKNKITTPEKNVPRKRPCISDINSFDPHPSNVSNLFNSLNDHKDMINKPQMNEIQSFKRSGPQTVKIEENSRKPQSVLKENTGFDNIQRMSSEIKSLLNMPVNNSEKNVFDRKTEQENYQAPSQDLSKKEDNNAAEIRWQNSWRTEKNSHAQFQNNNRQSSSMEKDSNETVKSPSFGYEKIKSPSNRYEKIKSPSFGHEKIKSPSNGYEKIKSPSLDDWFKQRKQTWRQRNSDSESGEDGNKNTTTIRSNLKEDKEDNKNTPKAVKDSGREERNKIKNISSVYTSASEDRCDNKNDSATIKNCLNKESQSNKDISETNENVERENQVKNKDVSPIKNCASKDRHGSKSGLAAVNKSTTKDIEKKKNIRKSSSVQSADQICSEKDALFCLQVTGQDLTSDLTVEKRMLEHVKSRRPELMKLIPQNSKSEEIPYSCEAIVILLRYLFSSYQKISSWKVALEIMALSLKYNLKRLKKMSEQYFAENPPTLQNVEEIIHNACYLKVMYHLNNVTKVEGLSLYQYMCITPLSMEFQYISSSCIVSSKLLIEPSEFCIPLNPVNHDFSAAFKKDIRNVLVFQAVTGTYILTGVQIKFDVHSAESVNIEYKVSKGNQMIVSDEKEKRLRSLIILNFGKDVLVQPSERVEVSVMIEDIQPRICSGVANFKCVQNSNGCHFTTELSSNVSPCLIFIEKLFYTVSF
ncbi:putative leucine-rich repeat-containing protein DDB_G0290503 [Parasteatoda tepidariorum]|uniref:putative leucine-rich repeat-containing protein DDB_G0290503 n=1 Tax=Parasteatoda tepidariorum TaxID=114398 RepID=UPI001C725D5B|nr:MATH and LRR domain-containing protein PFE0570w [Parasteatoda tepidariorum]